LGTAQALITQAKSGHGTVQAIIGHPNKYGHGQAKAEIQNNFPTGMAQAFIGSERYLVVYNKYQLPGYAQGESFDSVMNIDEHSAAYNDMSLSEYNGLQNKKISLRMLVMGETYLECKNQIQYAATIVRSNRVGFTPLYIQSHNKHYEALTTSIKMDASVSNRKTVGYQLEFEAKPWLISDELKTFGGSTGVIETTGRTLSNGTWTPTVIQMWGTNITVSGYTDTVSYTGFISVSGAVTGLIINTETHEATINGISSNFLMNNKDYGIYVGPNKTYFTVTGASALTVSYYDRWNL